MAKLCFKTFFQTKRYGAGQWPVRYFPKKNNNMRHQNKHGLNGHAGQAAMCQRSSLSRSQTGRFGRLFPNQQPHFISPADLEKMGAPGGPMSGGFDHETTNDVPLGMVFLGQFIDHDITLDTTSSLSRVNRAENTENFRSPSLDLDCIFGEGPEDEPFLFEKKSGKLLLLTGATNHNHGQPGHLRPFDLARTAEGVAILGDPRNDENRIVSQLQLAFIQCYNALYLEIEAASPNLAAKEIYEEAKRELTQLYHWIVLHEFLPAMVGEATLSQVLAGGRKYYLPCHGTFIPVEFSAAAYRFGHSMVNQFMRLQPGGQPFELFSREIGEGFRAIRDEREIVDWAAFFDFDGTFQRAGKLDTKLADDLLSLPPFVPPPRSLATRNLLRGNSFLLPSGETVARCMGRPEDEIRYVQKQAADNTSAYSINLQDGTPLWYYLLAEAECIGRQDRMGSLPGEGLGPVGGIIVAEVLVGLLEMDPHCFLNTNRNWQPRAGFSTMKDLLEKAATFVENCQAVHG